MTCLKRIDSDRQEGTYENDIKTFVCGRKFEVYSRYPNLFIKAKSTDKLEVSEILTSRITDRRAIEMQKGDKL